MPRRAACSMNESSAASMSVITGPAACLTIAEMRSRPWLCPPSTPTIATSGLPRVGLPTGRRATNAGHRDRAGSSGRASDAITPAPRNAARSVRGFCECGAAPAGVAWHADANTHPLRARGLPVRVRRCDRHRRVAARRLARHAGRGGRPLRGAGGCGADRVPARAEPRPPGAAARRRARCAPARSSTRRGTCSSSPTRYSPGTSCASGSPAPIAAMWT